MANNIEMKYHQINKKPTVADLVIEKIKNLVISGQIKKGDKFPNQNLLAEQLGVSRPSLREAMNRLSLLGVIEQTPGVGTLLISTNPELWVEFPEIPLEYDKEAIDELIEARLLIETQIIKLAANKITDKELSILSEMLEKMKLLISSQNIEQYLREDVLFHYLLAQSTQNRYILNMFAIISSLMEKFIRLAFKKNKSLIENSFMHHSNILNALTERDSKLAEKKMEQHIKDIKKYLSTT
jgi:GntR family transcriptional repressor for pyruvate dehydrogenase complex